jgi:hypothetical protein
MHLRPKRARGWLLVIGAALASCLAVAGVPSTALLSDSAPSTNTVSNARIFPGTRTTTAFSVTDASVGGSAADRSSPFAFAADGRTISTGAWGTAFTSDSYVQFDLNAPLPAGLAASSVSLRLTLSSASPAGTTCAYVEVRRISDNASLATYGSSGAPLACVSGTTLTFVGQSIPVIGSTDAANDLRVRVYGSDASGSGSVIDEATVTGSTPHSSFTLYPVRYTDAATAVPVIVPWELQGP